MPAEKLPEDEKVAPRRPPAVAEREPLTIVVVDAPSAEQVIRAPSRAGTRVRTGIDAGVPAEVPRRRWPYLLLVAAAAALTFSSVLCTDMARRATIAARGRAGRLG